MIRVCGVVALVVAATAAPASAAVELTPDGPASLVNRFTGATLGALTPPTVLVAARVTVGEGGREGTVRVSGLSGRNHPVAVDYPAAVGPAVTLPGTPGTYTLPAPRVHSGEHYWTRLGIEQETGGHAIVDAMTCTPDLGALADPCQIYWLDGLPGGSRGGAQLAITGVYEPDIDHDLLGDKTEDRTDLALSAGPTTRGADGRLQTAITVTNRGPLTADIPWLETPRDSRGGLRTVALATPTRDGWNECGEHVDWAFTGDELCLLGPLAPGESRTRTLTSSGPVQLVARAEGEDLQPADNTLQVTGVTPPPGTVAAAAKSSVKAVGRQTLRRGLKLTVEGEGRTRVTVAFKVRARTVRLVRTVTLRRDVARTVTLKATGSKLRTLRRAAARGTLRATISVRGANGTSASASAVVLR